MSKFRQAHRLLLAGSLLLSVPAYSMSPSLSKEQFDVVDLVKASSSLACMAWKPTGICFWLECKLFYCTINTSLRVKHYLPSAVVMVYKTPKTYPWRELGAIKSGISLKQNGITPPEIELADGSTNTPIQRRNVDIVGNPAITITSDILNMIGLGCESPITPLKPYYTSQLDYFSWRYSYTELMEKPVESLTPGIREVGFREPNDESMLNVGSWGSVFPRIGSLVQGDHYKASAVFAERAINIVTSGTKGHIYQDLDNEGRDGVWPPGESNEATESSGLWQMLSPTLEDKCHIFGDETQWQDSKDLRHKRSTSGDYAWLYWRQWECCEDKGSLLYTIKF